MPKDRQDRRDFDVVLWGATGFTGRLVAERLAARGGTRLRWALAGRRREALEQIAAGLGGPAPRPEILVGDAGDAASLDAIARRARVVCTTVGPYAKYGSGLVAACARHGTDYCDLTGETPWVRRMIDAHHDEAVASGAKIVNCCGFDSIPSDLGTLFVQDEFQRRFGKRAARVAAFFGEASGGASGGTFASMLNILDEAKRDRAVLRVLGDPYALDPVPRAGGPDGSDQKGPRWEPDIGKWTGPFVMAAINTRVVRRSNAVLGYPYGKDFRYRENMSVPGGRVKGLLLASGLSAGLGAFVAAVAIPALRGVIEKRLPAPGEGPSAEKRARGHWIVRLVGESEDGREKLLARVADRHGDPGYGSTAKMLAEAALCLAFDELPARGGLLTPASAMGQALIARLVDVGLTFEAQPLAARSGAGAGGRATRAAA